jgi:hypothetical protein
MQGSWHGEGRCVVYQQYARTLKLRVETERENLVYVLDHKSRIYVDALVFATVIIGPTVR